MASNTTLNLFNRFSLRGFMAQDRVFRTNDSMYFPEIKNKDEPIAHKSTIYSTLLVQVLSNSINMNEKVYTVDYSKAINSVFSKIPDDYIVCAYIDISRSAVMSPECAYPFGVPTTAGEIVTGNVKFLNHYITLSTKGDWRRYTAYIVLNIVVKDELRGLLDFTHMPLEYGSFVK